MRDSVESYLEHGANLSSEKSFRYRENFIAWGTQVRGRRGLVGSTLEKRHQIGVLVFELVCLRVCDGPALDTVLGSLVHPFSHRPELSSVLHRIYKWRHSLVDGVVYKFPGDIRDELCVAVLFLALCDVNVRAPCEDVAGHGCHANWLRWMRRALSREGDAGALSLWASPGGARPPRLGGHQCSLDALPDAQGGCGHKRTL